jgi:hypothetical protein
MVLLKMLPDILGLLPFISFGFWFVLFPNSVIKFYTWFHKGKARKYKPSAVRILGVVWLLLILGIEIKVKFF